MSVLGTSNYTWGRKLHFHLPPFPSLQDALFAFLAGQSLFPALPALFLVDQTPPLKPSNYIYDQWFKASTIGYSNAAISKCLFVARKFNKDVWKTICSVYTKPEPNNMLSRPNLSQQHQCIAIS